MVRVAALLIALCPATARAADGVDFERHVVGLLGKSGCTCEVAATIVVPSATSARASATAPITSPGPSSTPGSRWQCRSITPNT